jgi:hypothetical protein
MHAAVRAARAIPQTNDEPVLYSTGSFVRSGRQNQNL